MKIIYLFSSPTFGISSVQNKVMNQINSLNNCGVQCYGAFFSTEVNQLFEWKENIFFIPVKKTSWKYFKNIGQKNEIIKSMHLFVSSKYSETDFFYLRYFGANFSMSKFAKKFGKKIISEHQGKEIDELISQKKNNPFGFKLSKILGWLAYYKIPLINEKLWGNIFLKNINSIIGVTNEITKYQLDRGAKKGITISNSINVNQFSVREVPSFGYPIKLLFLKGTSSISPWNGFDRLIKSLDAFPDVENKFKLIVCGNKIKSEIPDRKYIDHIGYLSGSDLNKIFNEVHLGVSTLESYLKNLNESSILKTREYITRGLPFIYAYDDTDFNENLNEYAIKFKNDSSLIDFKLVENFAIKVYLNDNHANEMNQFASKFLDFDFKTKKLINFLENLK